MRTFINNITLLAYMLITAIISCHKHNNEGMNKSDSLKNSSEIYQETADSQLEKPINEESCIDSKKDILANTENLKLVVCGFSKQFCHEQIPNQIKKIIASYIFFNFLKSIYVLNDNDNTIEKYEILDNKISKIHSSAIRLNDSLDYKVYNNCMFFGNASIYHFDEDKIIEKKVNKKFKWYFKNSFGEYLIDTDGTEAFGL